MRVCLAGPCAPHSWHPDEPGTTAHTRSLAPLAAIPRRASGGRRTDNPGTLRQAYQSRRLTDEVLRDCGPVERHQHVGQRLVLDELLSAVLRRGPVEVSALPSAGPPPSVPEPEVSVGPLPRLPSDLVWGVVEAVRASLRAGRVEEAFASTRRLVPDAGEDAQGELVVLAPFR